MRVLLRSTISIVMFFVVAGPSCAQTMLSREYYIDYDPDSSRIGSSNEFRCGERTIDLQALLEKLRPAIDTKLAENKLDDIRTAVDFQEPSEIGFKEINGEEYIRYVFAKLLRPDVLIPGEGGVYRIIRPCTEQVVDAVLFSYP